MLSDKRTGFQSERTDGSKGELLSRPSSADLSLRFAGASKRHMSQDGKKNKQTHKHFFLQHLGRVNSRLCLLTQKGHDLIFSHFERAIV